MTDVPVAKLALLLLVASLVAILARRLRLPYSTGLVAAGFGLGFAPIGLDLPLTRDIVFTVFLPPLIFEAALQLNWEAFRRELPATLLLAFPGVVIAAAAVAWGAQALLGWSWTAAALFGVLIAATDPVSVIATFRELRVEPRLALLVEAESLLNDGAAAVGFSVVIAIAAGGAGSASAVAFSLVWTILGGVAAGGLVASLLMLIAWRTDDHLVEITLTTIAAYGSFLLAEHFGMSGVLATLTAGLLVGNLGWRRALTQSGRGLVLGFWEYAAFLANSLVFIVIGGHESEQPFGTFATASLIAVVLVLVGRVLAVYPLCLLLRPTRLAVPASYQHVLVWGRAARRAGARARPGVAGDAAGAAGDHRRRLRGGRLLDVRAGAEHAVAHHPARLPPWRRRRSGDVERVELLRPADAAQRETADRDQPVAQLFGQGLAEFGGRQRVAVHRAAHGADAADLVDRRPDDGEIQPVLAADVAVEHLAHMQAEVDLGGRPPLRAAPGVERVEVLAQLGLRDDGGPGRDPRAPRP